MRRFLAFLCALLVAASSAHAIHPYPRLPVGSASGGGGGGGWNTVYTRSFNFSSGGWNTYTIRNVIAAGSLGGTTGTSLRVTVQGVASGGATIDALYVGHKTGTYGFDGGQKQILFGGSGTIVLTTAAQTVSDTVTFAYDHTKDLVVSLHVSAGSTLAQTTGSSGQQSYYKAASDASTASPTGYTGPYDNEAYVVTKIEVQ